MTYLLDTNACIALINGTPVPVRAHFGKVIDAGHSVFVSSVAVFELWYDVAKSARAAWNAQRLESFLSGPVRELPFGANEAQTAGRLRAALETAGRPIGSYDLLIAGHALHQKLILVTANMREFRRVQGLVSEDWAKP